MFLYNYPKEKLILFQYFFNFCYAIKYLRFMTAFANFASPLTCRPICYLFPNRGFVSSSDVRSNPLQTTNEKHTSFKANPTLSNVIGTYKELPVSSVSMSGGLGSKLVPVNGTGF